jgi:FkbM family methyltransferase
MLKDAARLARYGMRMALRPRSVDIGGVRLNVPATAHGPVLASIYAEKYEGLEARELPRLLAPGDVVVEAGSAIGFIGLICQRIVGAGNVHMIEANADLIPEIKKNFALNGAPDPKIHHALAAAEDGPPTPFHVADQFWSSSVIAACATKRTDMVASIGLNALFRKTGATVFICDIEGGEFALLPMLDLSQLRLIVIEIHEKHALPGAGPAIKKFIADAGFYLAAEYKREVFIYRRLSPALAG